MARPALAPLLVSCACLATAVGGCSGPAAAERPNGASGSGAAGGTDNTTTGSGGTGAIATGGSSGSSGSSSAGGNSGSSSAGGSGGSGAAGGTSADAGSDVVHFEWPETVPGTGQCKPGLYQGTFQCTYTDPNGGAPVPSSGPISIRFAESTSGEFLDVSDGVLDGTANAFFSIRADVRGKLDCYRAAFSGNLINGTYSGFGLINGNFAGPLSSSYDHQSVALTNGTWQLTVAATGGACIGTWSASYVGP